MKNVLWIALLFVNVALIAQSGNGRPEGPRGPRGENFEKLKAELQLTDDQVAQWKEVQENMRAQLQELRDDESMERSQKREKIKEMRDAVNESIKGILTEEQYTRLEELRATRQERRANGKGKKKKKSKKESEERGQ